MKSPLRIALIPPLWTPVPPKTYGGIELMVHLLTESLVALGHDVTLFGTADSQTTARLQPVCERNMLDFMAATEACVYEAYANAAAARVLARASEFDVLHFHIGMHWLPFATLTETRSLFTLHTFPSYDDRWLAGNFPAVPLNAISRYQADQVTAATSRVLPVVYNGCDFSKFDFYNEPGQYLAFLGRMSHDKNPLDAIRIAQRAGMPIILAGQPQQKKEEQYFQEHILPLIDGDRVRYIGPVNHEQKNDLLRNAAALLFPIQWPEPFGLVMIEAMACGTPVLGHALGSVAEVIDPGLTGHHATNIDEMHELLPATLALDRRVVRQHAESRFSVSRMVEEYVALYRTLLAA